LLGHHRAHRLVHYAGAALGQHAHDVTLGKNSLDAAADVEHQNRADPLFAEQFDRGREVLARPDALPLLALGIKNCTHRHCRLPESNRNPVKRVTISLTSPEQQSCAGFVSGASAVTMFWE